MEAKTKNFFDVFQVFFDIIGGSLGHLSGCFWRLPPKILGGGEDLQMILLVWTIRGGEDTQPPKPPR